jgi:signal transduction histidine kinase
MSNLLPFPPHEHPGGEPFDLSDLVHEVCRSLEAESLRRRVDIEVDAPPYTMIRADRGQMERALQRLLEGALAATPAGGEIIVTTYSDDDGVELEVADSSSGYVQQLSCQTSDGPESAWDNVAGQDAWSEVRRIVANQGGQISVADCPEGGVAFTIQFPNSDDSDAESRKAA